jgi:exoribonuclease R
VTRREVRAAGLETAFAALRRELDAPVEFSPEALAEAEAAARKPLPGRAVDIPFVTIDPPGARDLDQALHIEGAGDGFRVHYAIADLGFFVTPGGALDAAVWERGVTLYAPDGSVPLHPPVLAAGAASLLPGEDRPAVLWTLDLDATGALTRTGVRRAVVRSQAQHTYADVPASLAPLLAEVGGLRAQIERDRGGVSLPLPEQEVEAEGESWRVVYRAPLDTEDHNAQISLLTGIAAADLMLANGVGLLRTLPPADEQALSRLRHAATALGVAWPHDLPYPDFIRSLDPADARAAAVLHEATGVMRGAAYVAFDGAPPEQPRHGALAEEYAHVTAPLRRLADRYTAECALAACAGTAVPDWVREKLPALPEAMRNADRRASALERAAVDIVEAAQLTGRTGEVFDAVAIDDDSVQLAEPAVRAKCDGPLSPGQPVRVRLVEADVISRTVRFVTA